MFEIDEDNLPFIRTRQAFLALDLQVDFLSPGKPLYVNDPPNFVENIVNVASSFRSSGDVIWIRTLYESSRAVNASFGESESVITDEEIAAPASSEKAKSGRRSSHKLLERYKMMEESRAAGGETEALEADNDEIEPTIETYLTVDPGRSPIAALPSSTGPNLSQAVCNVLDPDKDLIFIKSHYSAFKDGQLVQILRARFVTEIFICGALTNISVFATAMDAARHGYAITLLEDCLGYRNKARHDEALRKLTEFTGCDIISSSEFIADLQQKAKVTKKTAPRRNLRPGQKDSSLEKLMSNLKLKSPSHSSQGVIQPSEKVPVASGASPESQLSNELLDEAMPPGDEAPKRERVKTKVRARKRPPKSGSAPTSQENAVSETLNAVTQSLEKLPAATKARPDSSTETIESKSSSSIQESMESEPQTASKESPVALPLSKPKETTEPVPDDPTPLCEGDTNIIEKVLSKELSDGIFDRIRDEIQWQKMSHQGGDVPRLVAVQGEVAKDGSIPIYRHPADESPPMLPFSTTVQLIRAEVEKKLGHSLNHVLIQYYRDGMDYISEHSDKTLDIVPNTFIANISLGAQRTMVFRTKKSAKLEDAPEEKVPPRNACRAPLPDNSMCKMGLVTNMRWLHAIRQDKRLMSERSEAELAYGGGRISLTFRLIGTFLDKDQQKIWGQGATSKIKKDAKTVINGNGDEAEQMIRAFGTENRSSEFDWAEHYGNGFDVLHISNSPKLFLSGDNIEDLRVKMLLAEHSIAWTEGKLSPSFNWKDGSAHTAAPPIPDRLPVKFVDNDLSKSTVTGDIAILLYLDAVYGSKSKTAAKSQVGLARQFTRLYQADNLLRKWRAIPFSVKPFRRELYLWEVFAQEAPYIAGSTISLADYALFAILHDMAAEWGPGACEFEHLNAYFVRMTKMESVKKALSYTGEGSSQITSKDSPEDDVRLEPSK